MHPRNKFLGALKTYWPLLLPVIFLLPNLAAFPYPGSGALYSDFAITHYPNAVLLKSALAEGTIPLWSPQILSGFPFIAHPYSGIWYPPYWLAMLFSLPVGLNLLLVLHLVWAGVGAYKLVRQSGLGHEAGLLSGVAFAAAPKIFAHLGAGHLILLLAVSWTPWLIWSSRSHPLSSSWLHRLARPGLILALIAAADPRWAIYAGLLWLGWVVYSRWNLRAIFIELLIAAGLAAPALLLYAQYGALSTRAGLASQPLELSLPFANLLGLLIPQWAGFHEWVIYPGIIVVLLTVAAQPWQPNGRKDRFWLFVLVASILLALGEAVPGLRELASLPGFSQLRVPPRSLFLASLAFAWLAGAGLQSLLEIQPPAKVLRLACVGLFAGVGSLAIALLLAGADLWRAAAWSAAALLLFLMLFEFRARKLLSIRTFAFGVLALLMLDLYAIDVSLVRFRSAEDVLNEGAAVAKFLAADPDRFRVYSPSFSIPQQTAAAYAIELADGVDPLQLRSYAAFMSAASGVPGSAYSVTLPPLAASADPALANAAYAPSAELLGLLNVKYVVSAFPLLAPGLIELTQIDSTYIYTNELYRPRAWIENESGMTAVDDLRWNYNEISATVRGPGTLVFSELDYPGWVAQVDGAEVEIEPYRGILRSVELDAGSHQVTMQFRPPLLVVGLILSAITFGLIIFLPRAKRA